MQYLYAMLQKLHIQNYAIIDELELQPGRHLNIITGETGAGKSILLGALSLILGERADSASLRDAAKKCIVEGWFAVEGHENVQRFLQNNELDADAQLCIRREIAVNGKSRAFVNDTPVNLGQLQQLAAMMVDLHQQFDTLQLGSQNFQREVLDAIAGNEKPLKEYQTLFHQYNKVKKELEVLQQQQAQANKEIDYHRFLYDELQEAGFAENELEQLDAELKVLSNAEHIKEVLSNAGMALTQGETPVVQQVKQVQQLIKNITAFHEAVAALNGRLHAVELELKDVADELERINDAVSLDAERIQVVNDRLALGYKLLKKHGLQTTEQLLALQGELEAKLQQVLNVSEAISQKEKETALLLQTATAKAQALHQAREKQVAPFAKKVNALLLQVGMPNAQLKLELQPAALNEWGGSTIEFLFDANKSGRWDPLRKVASGGELSRLMLCIKNLVAGSMQLPTLIFDEIDTGISGEAARQVGVIMKQLASRHQILCITHQAQIAATADAHYFVYKAIQNNHISTGIKQLSHDERITTIAQMLSGEKPTAAALENAREMVGN
jgi:DNA repair protein RecN (Recombination protein N)